MGHDSGRTPVESHTEYVRTRVRCVDCGDYVPARKRRCVNCTGETA